MIKYPSINDDNFYSKINSIYKKYKIPKESKTMKEICFPSKYQLQIPQKFVAEFINPNTPYKGLLLYHQIGAGKTCAAINIAEKWKEERNILIVSPASLMGNFYKELKTECPGDAYITKQERKDLNNLNPASEKYKQIAKISKKRINNYYTIMSYNRFITALEENKIKFKNTLLILDEVQNIVSEKGIFYKIILKAISKAPDDLRMILLSGTPIFDKPVEIALTLNLLRMPKDLPIGNEFNEMFLRQVKNNMGEIVYTTKNMKQFKKIIKGYVSYFRGAPPVAFPKKEVKYIKCKMSNYQYKSYKTVATNEGPFRTGDILKLPNNFFIGSRVISNIAFPSKNIKEEGYRLFKGQHLKMSNLKEYSIKFYKILKSIKKSQGPAFVYSNFKEYGGLKSFVKVLEYNGFKNYKTHGEGKKRFAVWSGDEPHEIKEEIKDVFNQKSNRDGNKIKIMLGSPSIKEGVSLLRVKEVHVMEPYWNFSRLDQVIGRAVRFCSHKDLPLSERKIQVKIYLAVHPDDPMTVDRYILNLAEKKQNLIDEFEMAIKEAAVDCNLNKNANVHKQEKDIKCIK